MSLHRESRKKARSGRSLGTRLSAWLGARRAALVRADRRTPGLTGLLTLDWKTRDKRTRRRGCNRCLRTTGPLGGGRRSTRTGERSMLSVRYLRKTHPGPWSGLAITLAWPPRFQVPPRGYTHERLEGHAQHSDMSWPGPGNIQHAVFSLQAERMRAHAIDSGSCPRGHRSIRVLCMLLGVIDLGAWLMQSGPQPSGSCTARQLTRCPAAINKIGFRSRQ